MIRMLLGFSQRERKEHACGLKGHGGNKIQQAQDSVILTSVYHKKTRLALKPASSSS